MAKLLDIFNPIFNVKEVCKELVLLEDHLVAPGKHCPDCIRKHLLRAEAFAEEALAIDKTGEHKDNLQELPGQIREIGEDYMNGEMDKHALGQKVRFIRKALSPICFVKKDKKAGDKNSSPGFTEPLKFDANIDTGSGVAWDFWSSVANDLNIPTESIVTFSKALKSCADSEMEPYFEFSAPGVSYRVKNSTDWVQKELTKRLKASVIARMVSVATSKGKKYTIQDWAVGINSALGKTTEQVKFEAPSSSLGEFVSSRNVQKRAYKAGLDAGLYGLIRKARKAEKSPSRKMQILGARYFEKIGDVSKIDFFWAKAAELYGDMNKSAEETRSLGKILKHYPNHDLRFWITNRIMIFNKQSEMVAKKMLPSSTVGGSNVGSKNKITEGLKLAGPLAIGFAIGLL